MRRLGAGVVDWLFPPVCAGCEAPLRGDYSGMLCSRCAESNQRIRLPYCSVCGRPFVSDVERECGECIGNQPHYHRMRAAFRYQESIRQAIIDLKFNHRMHRAPALGRLLLLCEDGGIDFETYDLVAPVPLHDNRLRKRGFNQCTLMIREVAAHRNIHAAVDLLVRVRDTQPQFSLTQAQRKTNVKNAFAVRKPGSAFGKTVLLIDDVTTTGSTIRECARELRNDGATRVDVAVLARAMDDVVT